MKKLSDDDGHITYLNLQNLQACSIQLWLQLRTIIGLLLDFAFYPTSLLSYEIVTC